MKYRKALLRLGLVVASFLTLFLVGFLIFRNSLLQLAIEKSQSRLKKSYGLNLHIDKAAFTGLFSLRITELSLIPEGKDTLFRSDTAEFSLRVLPLIIGSLELSSLKIAGPELILFNTAERCNWCGLRRLKSRKNPNLSTAEILFRLIESTLDKIPAYVEIKRAAGFYTDSTGTAGIMTPHFLLNREQFQTSFQTFNSLDTQGWEADGTLIPSDLQGRFRLRPSGSGKGVADWFGLKAGWSMLSGSFSNISFEEETLNMTLEGSVENLQVQHESLSDSAVLIPKASASINLHMDKESVVMDSSSKFNIDRLNWTMYARYAWKPEKDYTLHMSIPWTPAQDFLGSLPSALFGNLAGIRATGKLRYRFMAHLNDKNPDAAMMSSKLDQDQFKIIRFGAAKLQDLYQPFSYYFFLKGKLQRSVYVGEENPNYRKLEQIAPTLKNAVLTGEDPNFYGHKGFEPEAIRGALIANYKAGRFRRGGSTISMQLVKNLFLNRRKTLARKLEEVLLVWLLENHTNISKNRLLEIYLNIIEWGPGIIGANEAAQFYFAKDASALDPLESAYLAAIVPSPRRFAGWFNEQGKLNRNDLHFRVIRQVMQHKGMAPVDTSTQVPPLMLRGRALNFLPKNEATPPEQETETWNE